MSGDAIAVGVPVRNEVERLPNLLSAIASQQDAPPFTLALFFDNCDDGSEALVEALAQSLPFRIISDCCRAGGQPSAGLARRRAMTLAASVAPSGMLLTTDADSAPAPDWIAAALRGLHAADLVAGRIIHEAGGSVIQAQLEAYLDRLHNLRRLLDPVPWEAAVTHHWTSAASMAMPCAVYKDSGGFPTSARSEDAGFADAAARRGYRLRRDAAVRVTTSARRHGRAPGGFAASLSGWDEAALPPYVADPDDEAWRYIRQAEARRMQELDALAARLGLPLAEVEQVAGECRNGEAFAARIVGPPPGGMRQVPLPRAERLLAMLEQTALEGAA